MDEPDTAGPGGITPRLHRRIAADFAGAAPQVVARLGRVDLGGQDGERVLAAIVLAAGGHHERIDAMIELAHVDWRDVLVAGGLAHTDWPQRLDRLLGTP